MTDTAAAPPVTTESVVEELESFMGMAMMFYPPTAPFAIPVMSTLPTVTHGIFTAVGGKVDQATQAALVAQSISTTAAAVDAVSTGGQKKTLDAITQPLAPGGPSFLDAMSASMVSIMQKLKTLETQPALAPASPLPAAQAEPVVDPEKNG